MFQIVDGIGWRAIPAKLVKVSAPPQLPELVVRAQIPESEMADLIVELRSATAGVGTYTAKFHHLAELTGRLADNVLNAHKAAAE